MLTPYQGTAGTRSRSAGRSFRKPSAAFLAGSAQVTVFPTFYILIV